MQIQMLKTHAAIYRDRLRELTDEKNRENGMGSIEMAILVVALIGIAVALVALLQGAFANRSAGIN